MEQKIHKLADQFLDQRERQQPRHNKQDKSHGKNYWRNLHNFARVNRNAFRPFHGIHSKSKSEKSVAKSIDDDDQVPRLKGVYTSRAQVIQREIDHLRNANSIPRSVRSTSWRPMTVAARRLDRYMSKSRRERATHRMTVDYDEYDELDDYGYVDIDFDFEDAYYGLGYYEDDDLSEFRGCDDDGPWCGW